MANNIICDNCKSRILEGNHNACSRKLTVGYCKDCNKDFHSNKAYSEHICTKVESNKLNGTIDADGAYHPGFVTVNTSNLAYKEFNALINNDLTAGVKYDKGKTQVSLIPSEVIFGLADVLTFGAQKYGPQNWKNGIDYTRLMDATYRHLLAFQSGEDTDKESGLSHLYHAMANLTFLAYHNNHIKERDNRWEKKDGKEDASK